MPSDPNVDPTWTPEQDDPRYTPILEALSVMVPDDEVPEFAAETVRAVAEADRAAGWVRVRATDLAVLRRLAGPGGKAVDALVRADEALGWRP